MWQPLRPAVAEERWLALAARYPALRPDIEQAGHVGGWKTTTWLGRCLGFVLGLVAAGMLVGVMALFPASWLLAGVLLVVAAEWLVAKRHQFRSGIEEALYACGAVLVVVQVLDWVPTSSMAAAVLLVAAALGLVGWRLLNPLFTTLAIACGSLAIALFDARISGGSLNTLAAALFCTAGGVLALFLGARVWQRPAHDHMVDGLVMSMPWLAFGWLVAYGWRNDTRTLGALLVALGFFAACVFIGIKRRQHAPLWSALGSLACMAFALHELLPWPAHWQLMAAGAALLAAAVLLDRTLRQRRAGITSQPLDAQTEMDVLQLAGAASLAPPVAAPAAGFEGQGGGFGGGGASGRF